MEEASHIQEPLPDTKASGHIGDRPILEDQDGKIIYADDNSHAKKVIPKPVYVRLKTDVLRNIRGITLEGIPYTTFHKGVIVEITEDNFKTIKDAKKDRLFDVISAEDYKKFLEIRLKEGKAELDFMTTHHEEASKVDIGAMKEEDMTATKPTETKEEAPKEPEKIVNFTHVYTQDEAFKLLKADQIKVLKDRGIEAGSLEGERVKQIMDSNPTA